MCNRNYFGYLFGALLTAVGIGSLAMPAAAADHPKISMSEARAIALKAYSGTIVKSELEREHGGSGLRYSFDMRKGGKWREVGIDAMTGRVLENSPEGANPSD
jgi:uncharacterized membrane protein YkoI